MKNNKDQYTVWLQDADYARLMRRKSQTGLPIWKTVEQALDALEDKERRVRDEA